MLREPVPAYMMLDDHTLPLVGLGVYKIDDEEPMDNAVAAAIDCGIRMFDTASFYGNEDLLGDALAKCGVPRSELFLTTKIWNTAQIMGDVRGSVERSMERLQTDYLDLYLIHWPVQGSFVRTWNELVALREEGLLRSIGVSNFEVRHLETLMLSSDVLPAVNQFECHPLRTRTDLVDYCQARGIAVQAYAPLARGAYIDRPILQQIGERYGKTAAQVGLRFLVQRNISVIPKSVSPERIRQNLDIFDFTLTETEMQSIYLLDEHLRTASVPDDMASEFAE